MNFQTFQTKLFDFLSEDPINCINMGLEKNLGHLPDPGKNKRITNQGKIKMLKHALGKIDKNELSFDEQIDYELCELKLEQLRINYELEIDGVPMQMRMPVGSQYISGPMFMLFINDPREDKYRIANITSMMKEVPDYLTSYKRNLKEPVKRWLDMELQSLKGLPGFFDTLLNWAKEKEFKNLPLFESVTHKAKLALEDYKLFLENQTTTENIIIGEAQMLEVLKSRGIHLSPNELHKIAKDFIHKNKKSVEELRGKLCQKYELSTSTTAQELQKFLKKKYAVKREGEGFEFLLNRYQKERQKIIDYIKNKNLFPIMDDQDMHIMQTPDFMKPTIPAGAMMPALAMREGIKKSLVYLTLSEELLDEHTEISIPGMMIHEGIPGHHLQFAWAATNQSIIRRIFNANDLSEGWTTMLEDYMLDIGYAGDLEDEIRFSGKRDIARIGVRVAIDLYFMSGDKKYLDLDLGLTFDSEDVFENAGKLLKHVTGFVDDRVNGELNWYSQEKGYPLSYLAGNYLVWKLKEKMQGKMSDKEFHTKFLEAGNMPISLLEKVFAH